jgi:hypothetical protein
MYAVQSPPYSNAKLSKNGTGKRKKTMLRRMRSKLFMRRNRTLVISLEGCRRSVVVQWPVILFLRQKLTFESPEVSPSPTIHSNRAHRISELTPGLTPSPRRCRRCPRRPPPPQAQARPLPSVRAAAAPSPSQSPSTAARAHRPASSAAAVARQHARRRPAVCALSKFPSVRSVGSRKIYSIFRNPSRVTASS